MNFEDWFKMHWACQDYRSAENFVLSAIQSENYPDGHPFLEYSSHTTDGLAVINIILLKLFGLDDSAIVDIVKKCKSVENGQFDYTRYRQNINEVVFLCYILISMSLKGHSIPHVCYEDHNIIDNNKVTEYSFLLKDILINIEVKTLSCDAFPSGVVNDGNQYILPYYKDKKFIQDLKNKFPNATILDDKCCLYQLERNILKIKSKFDGKNMTQYKLFNVGVIFIDYSTSLEQFFSYLFNNKFGLVGKTDFGNIDALIMITLDAKVDLLYTNIYNMGYVQTLLFNNAANFVDICKLLRLDNFALQGTTSYEKIIKYAQNEYEVLKILKRNGFANFIPYDTPENEIQEYIDFLCGNAPRKTTAKDYFTPEKTIYRKI